MTPTELVLDAMHRADPVFGGVGLTVALALLLVSFVLLPRDGRGKARGPLWLVLGHVTCALSLLVLPDRGVITKSAVVLGAFLLLASLGRSAFLLLVDSLWTRRSGRPVPQILRDVLQAVLYAVIGLLVLRAAGVEPGSLLTTSALLTAVIGLSLQETLGNLFAGLAIQAQRPFDVGDWLEFDQGHVGRVLEINWRATRIVTIENVEIVVPNGAVAKAPIHNFSRSAPVRRSVLVSTTYDAAPGLVKELLHQAVVDIPGVLKEPRPSVVTKDFIDTGILYEVRYFISDYAAREVIDGQARDRVWYALKRNDLPLPYPFRTLRFAPPEPAPDPEAGDARAEALIHANEIFSHLPGTVTRSLARACRRRVYTTEEHIVRRGDEGSEMFIIASGQVRVALEADGHSHTLAELGPGQCFGEMSLMTGEGRTADVVSIRDTEVLVLDRSALAPVLEREPELAGRFSQVLAERRQRIRELEGSAHTNTEAPDQHELLGRIRDFFRL